MEHLSYPKILNCVHNVVATGKGENTYTINDPEGWSHNLTYYDNNDFIDIHQYLPSKTDLSGLQIVVNPEVELLLEDGQIQKTGKIIEGNQITEYKEIPDAVYTYELPISNPNESGEVENFGTGINAFYLSDLESGDYKITISSDTNEFYTLNIAAFQENGKMVLDKFVGIVSAESNEIIDFDYSKTSPSASERVVTFNSAMKDVNELWILRFITDKKLRKELFQTLRKTKQDVRKNNISKALEKLEGAREILNTGNGNGITQDAYEILLYDINYLKNNLFSPTVYIEALTSPDIDEIKD